jgi:hypothetical protein
LFAVFTDSSGILLSKNFCGSVGDDPLEILRNIKITRPSHLIEKRQYSRRLHAGHKGPSFVTTNAPRSAGQPPDGRHS